MDTQKTQHILIFFLINLTSINDIQIKNRRDNNSLSLILMC